MLYLREIATKIIEEEYREKIYQERQQQFEYEDFDAYDIFDMFFGNIDPEILRRQRRRFRRAQAQQQVQINPRLIKFMPFINLIPFLLMSLTYLLPYIFRSKELYVFEKNKDYPYEKKTNRYKINYYVGKDFEEKYKDKEDGLEMRKVENEIENKYLTYLKIECQERTQLKEETRKKTIWQKVIILIC